MTKLDKPLMQKTILAIGLMFSSVAWSAAPNECETEPHRIDIKYEACLEKTNDYPAMMACVETANSEWQKEMSSIYGKLQSRLKPKDHSTLQNAQKAWQAYHDAEFTLYNAMQAGEEVDAFMFAEKKMRVIGNRAKELQNFSDYVFLAEP